MFGPVSRVSTRGHKLSSLGAWQVARCPPTVRGKHFATSSSQRMSLPPSPPAPPPDEAQLTATSVRSAFAVFAALLGIALFLCVCTYLVHRTQPKVTTQLPRHRVMVKVQSRHCPSSAHVPPQVAPSGSGQLGTPRKRPAHCLGCSSDPKSPTSPPFDHSGACRGACLAASG